MFYVENTGWVPASMLKKGDILSLEDGRELPIQSIKEVTYSYYINVYNFEVEDYHTYYVSDSSILVHNMCNDYNRNRKQALNEAKDMAGIPRSQSPSRQWVCGDNICSTNNRKIHNDSSRIVAH